MYLRHDIEMNISFTMQCDALSYIYRPCDFRGNSKSQKALEIGVPKQALLGALQKGMSVFLKYGTKVKISTVM